MARKLATFIAVVALVLGGVPAALAAPPAQYPAGAAGIGDPYYPLDGNGGYDVSHYDLALTLRPGHGRPDRRRHDPGEGDPEPGPVRPRLRRPAPAVGRPSTAHPRHFQRKDQELIVKPRTGLASGANFTVVARYDGVPATLEDFGTSGFIHTDDGAIVMGEPHVAATLVPGQRPSPRQGLGSRSTSPSRPDSRRIANGKLLGSQTNGAWTTWNWDAVEPMATYLATMAIGHFDVDAVHGRRHRSTGTRSTRRCWRPPPAIAPSSPALSSSTRRSPSATYKRLTRTIAVPAGGATLSFDTIRDTEHGWDFLFVEARTAGADDWTTLPDIERPHEPGHRRVPVQLLGPPDAVTSTT